MGDMKKNPGTIQTISRRPGAATYGPTIGLTERSCVIRILPGKPGDAVFKFLPKDFEKAALKAMACLMDPPALGGTLKFGSVEGNVDALELQLFGTGSWRDSVDH